METFQNLLEKKDRTHPISMHLYYDNVDEVLIRAYIENMTKSGGRSLKSIFIDAIKGSPDYINFINYNISAIPGFSAIKLPYQVATNFVKESETKIKEDKILKSEKTIKLSDKTIEEIDDIMNDMCPE